MKFVTLSVEQPDPREIKRWEASLAQYEENLKPFGDIDKLSPDSQANLRSQRPKAPLPYSYRDQIVLLLLTDLGKEGLTIEDHRKRTKLVAKVEDAEEGSVFGFEDDWYEIVKDLVNRQKWVGVRPCFEHFVDAVNSPTDEPGLPQIGVSTNHHEDARELADVSA